MSAAPVRPHRCHRVVVVGAGYAGLLAAARLAGHPGIAVTIVDPSPVFRERIRLHQWATGQRRRLRPMRELIAAGVAWRQTRAEAIDLERREVTLADGDAVGYDVLVLAVGSVVDRSRVPGVVEHCLSLQTVEDCAAIARQAGRGGRAVVVGLGLTGIETACELAEVYPGLRVTLLGRGCLEDRFSEAGAAHLRACFARLGVSLVERASVTRVMAGAVEVDGEEMGCELCVWSAGFVAPDLAARAGLPVAADGRVPVDAGLRVSGHPEVLVIGDAARVVLEGSMVPLRMACATAMPMGAHAADQVLAQVEGRPPTPLRYGASVACVSLGRRDGLIQMLSADDRPRAQVLRGRLAVFAKEAICRMTVVALRAEARGVRLYHWPRPRPTPSLPAAPADVQS